MLNTAISKTAMFDSTLVKFDIDDQSITMTTLSRERGKSRRFFISKERFRQWIDSSERGTFYDKDIYSFLEARVDGDKIVVHMTWLDSRGENLHGYTEFFAIKMSKAVAFLEEGHKEMRVLSINIHHAPSFDFAHAGKSLHNCILSKHKRRALCKALRSINWHDTHFTLYNDGMDSFGFRTNDRCPIVGGLILHHDNQQTGHGTYQRLYFGIHT